MLNMDGGSDLQKKVLFSAAVVLITGVFGFLTYRDFREISRIETEIESTETAIRVAKGKIAKIPGLEKDVIVRRENLNEYVQILPDDNEINDFVNKINNFADRSGVGVSQLDDLGGRTRGNQKQSKDAFEKLVYKVELRGTTDSILNFVNAFESYDRFVKVSSVDIRRGKSSSDDGGPAIHQGNLELETYVYNPGSGAIKPVKIKDYESKRDELGDAIAASRNAIEIARYQLDSSPRRDPLSDPRLAGVQGPGDHLVPLEEQEKTLASLTGEIDQIMAQIDLEGSDVSTFGVVERAELKRQINERLTLLQETILGYAEKNYFSGTVKSRFNAQVVEPVGRLLSDRNIMGSTALTLEELERVYSSMQATFAREQFQEVLAAYSQVEGRFHFVTGTDEGIELIKQIEKVRNESSAILEFTDRNVSVTGVIYRPNNGSVAVVNGKVLGVGDTLDGDILVTGIDVDEVEFSFKSVSIRRIVE